MESRAYKTVKNQELSELLYFGNTSLEGLTGGQGFDILAMLS